MSAMSERAATIERLVSDLSQDEARAIVARLAGEHGYDLVARPARPSFAHLRDAEAQSAASRVPSELRAACAESPIEFAREAHRLLRTCEMCIALLMARHVSAAHADFKNADDLVEMITAVCDVGDAASWFTAPDRPAALSADEAIAWLAVRPNYELSHGYDDPEDEGSWRVHRVNGGVNDREWTLVATGSTPLYAIQAAAEKADA